MQQVNLYLQLDRAVEPPLSAKQQVMGLAAVAVVILFIYAVLAVLASVQSTSVSALRAEQNQLSRSLERLQAEKQALEDNQPLFKEIAELEAEVKFRRQLLRSINPEDKPDANGFAPYLQGLGRQTIDGMWFTSIHLTNSGREMALTGRANKAEFLPRYLQKLAKEQTFDGQQFSVLRIAAPDKPGPLMFSVRAKQKGEI